MSLSGNLFLTGSQYDKQNAYFLAVNSSIICHSLPAV